MDKVVLTSSETEEDRGFYNFTNEENLKRKRNPRTEQVDESGKQLYVPLRIPNCFLEVDDHGLGYGIAMAANLMQQLTGASVGDMFAKECAEIAVGARNNKTKIRLDQRTTIKACRKLMTHNENLPIRNTMPVDGDLTINYMYKGEDPDSDNALPRDLFDPYSEINSAENQTQQMAIAIQGLIKSGEEGAIYIYYRGLLKPDPNHPEGDIPVMDWYVPLFEFRNGSYRVFEAPVDGVQGALEAIARHIDTFTAEAPKYMRRVNPFSMGRQIILGGGEKIKITRTVDGAEIEEEIENKYVVAEPGEQLVLYNVDHERCLIPAMKYTNEEEKILLGSMFRCPGRDHIMFTGPLMLKIVELMNIVSAAIKHALVLGAQ